MQKGDVTHVLNDPLARITIVPEWAKLLDFETRIPTAVAQLVNR